MDSDNIKVLPACREDYNDLLELCRKSGLYYSYIDCSLKEWLGFSGKPDPNRYTEIFYLNGKKIGFSSRIIFEDYIFQDMLRIDRAYQRKGFSRISIERGIELARAHNLSKIRMSVDGSKEPALKRAIRFGFSEIGEWTVFVFTRFDFISGKNNIANDIHIAEPGGLPSVLEFIKANSSSFSTKMYARRYSWRPLDEGNLIKEIQDKKLLIKKSNGGIKSFSLYKIYKDEAVGMILEINQFVADGFSFLGFLLDDIPASGVQRIRIYIPGNYLKHPPPAFKNYRQKLLFKIFEKNF